MAEHKHPGSKSPQQNADQRRTGQSTDKHEEKRRAGGKYAQIAGGFGDSSR